MKARVSIHVPLFAALGMSALAFVAIFVWGLEPKKATGFFVLSAYLLGDGMGAALQSVRGTFFSKLLPAPGRRMWRQAVVWSLIFLAPGVLVTGWTGGLDFAFRLLSLELLAVSSSLTIASWLPRIELRYLTAFLLTSLIRPTSLWMAKVSWSLWHQGLLSLLSCVPVLALCLLALWRSPLLGKSKTQGSRYVLLRRWFPIERIPQLRTSSKELASDARWHHWLRLAVFESGPTPWWLLLLVAPLLFTALLLLPNFVSSLSGADIKIWRYLLVFAIGAINLLNIFKGPRLELTLRYPLSRKTQATLTSAAASLTTLCSLVSSLSLLGLLWLAQVGFGLTAAPLPLAPALVFAIFAAAFATVLQDVRKLGLASLPAFIIFFLLYLDFFDWLFLGETKPGIFAFTLTAAIAIFCLIQLLAWLGPRHASRHRDLYLPGSHPSLRAWQ